MSQDTTRPCTLGIDLHKRFAYWHLLAEDTSVLWHGKVTTTKDVTLAQLASLPVAPEHIKAVIEPVEQWGWYADLLEEAQVSVSLADALHVKLIAASRKKDDRVDARALAELLHKDYLPRAFLASKEARDLRELLRTRVTLVRMRTRLKNRIHSILGKHGLIFPYTNVLGKRKAPAWLESADLRTVYRLELESVRTLAIATTDEIARFDEEIRTRAQDDRDALLLTTMPGIGPFRALLIKAEVGDFARFPTPDKLAAYAGLVSSSHSSGGVLRFGHITKQGSRYLRWALVTAAVQVKPAWGDLYTFHERIKEKKGVKVARVALARKLATIAWHLIHKQEPFRAPLVSSGGVKR